MKTVAIILAVLAVAGCGPSRADIDQAKSLMEQAARAKSYREATWELCRVTMGDDYEKASNCVGAGDTLKPRLVAFCAPFIKRWNKVAACTETEWVKGSVAADGKVQEFCADHLEACRAAKDLSAMAR